MEFMMNTGPIQECRIHVQERLSELSMVQAADARRLARFNRRDSIQSTTSTLSVPPSFGSSVPVRMGKSAENLDSSPSSGLDIPSLIPSPRSSANEVSETTPATPRFASAVRQELAELHKNTVRSEAVEGINKASRAPRLSVGSEQLEDSGSKIKQVPKPGGAVSTASDELDFDSISRGQRVPPVSTPWPTASVEVTQPKIGSASVQMMDKVSRNNVKPASNIDELSGVETLLPKFIRRRSAPATHQVVTDEVDFEMYDKVDRDASSLEDLSVWLKGEKGDSKEEPWTRLNELACFALCGFGQFNATLGIGVFNKERRSTLIRQGLTDRDRLWGGGVRVPIGNRIAHGAAALLRGTMSAENIDDNSLLVSDFIPITQEAYENFQPDGKKNEPRKKQSLIVEKWVKAAKQHTLMFCLIHGEEHGRERRERIMELEKIHEARPDIFTVDIISGVYEEMNYLYCAQIREGTRKIMRLGGEGMKKPSFARIALNPTANNRTRWEYPTVFLMHHEAGHWLSRVIPRMEEKVSKSTWKTLAEQEKRKGAGGNVNEMIESEEEVVNIAIDKDKRRIYPAGKPLRLEERQLSTQFRPKSTSAGDYLCWDFSSHAGCTEKANSCPKGKHDMMSPNGLHYSMLMQMARRGGHKSGRRIEPEKIDGHIQALRDNAAAESKAKRQPSPKKEYAVWVPKAKAVGNESSGKIDTMLTVEADPGWMAHKTGLEKNFPLVDAERNAVSRANGLAQEIANEAVIANANTLPRKVQWSAGRLGALPSEQLTKRIKSWHWDKCALPLDFRTFDFADLEDGTRALFHMKDDWMYQDETPPILMEQTESTIQQRIIIDDWWAVYLPELDGTLVPLVKEMMCSGFTDLISMEELYSQILQQLIDGGSAEQVSRSVISMEKLKQRTTGRAGNVHVPRILWGPKMKCEEFETQEVSFGALHFIAVDVG